MRKVQRLPDAILMGYLQGNTLLPQANAATVILTGKAFHDTCLDPAMDGERLFTEHPIIDDDQVALAVRTMQALHVNNNVSCIPNEPFERRVKALIGGAVLQARDTIVGFAQCQTLNRPGIHLGRTPETIAQFLFSHKESGLLVHPEGLALQGMWAATKRAMFSGAGQEAMSDYRARALAAMVREGDEFNHARDTVKYELRDIVIGAIHEALPQIQADTGVHINNETVNDFMSRNELSA